MDRIHEYNPDASYRPNRGRYLQLISARDLYIQNITVAEYDSHSDGFQVKLPNVFTNYPLGAVRVEDQKFIDWDHYKFTLWQTQLNFVVFCASSANDKEYISIPCLLSYQKNIENNGNSTAI